MKKLILTLTIFPVFQLYSQEINITNIAVKNKKIFIEYELTGNDSYEIQLYYRSKSDYTWIGPLNQLDGDFGKKIKEGDEKLITWNTLDEVDHFIGEYQFGIEAISNKTEIEIKESNQNSYNNYSYNSFSFLDVFDIFSDGYVTPYIAWPYSTGRQFYSYPNQFYTYIPICVTIGSSYVKSNSEWEYGADLSFVFGASNNVTWLNQDSTYEHSATHKYFQTRLLARANYFVLDKHYLGFGFGGKLIKEVSKSNLNEYNNTLRTFRLAARLVIGGRYDSGFTWEFGLGGGGIMIGYSFYI